MSVELISFTAPSFQAGVSVVLLDAASSCGVSINDCWVLMGHF